MGNISKKLLQYKGYIFLESLIAFSLTCFIIGSYFSMTTFLLKQKKEAFDALVMQRILYEEVKQFANYGGDLQRKRVENNKIYVITFSMEGKIPVKMEITDGEASFNIER